MKPKGARVDYALDRRAFMVRGSLRVAPLGTEAEQPRRGI